MKKLDQIEKKNIFETPGGYFDHLPGIIQARLEAEKPRPIYMPYYRFALRFALPVAAVVLAVFLIFQQGNTERSAEQLLAAVSSEELAIYLAEADVSTELLLEEIDFNEADLEGLNPAGMLLQDELEQVELESLLEEYQTEYY